MLGLNIYNFVFDFLWHFLGNLFDSLALIWHHEIFLLFFLNSSNLLHGCSCLRSSFFKHGVEFISVIDDVSSCGTAESLLLSFQILSQFDFLRDFSAEEVSGLFLRIEIVPLWVDIFFFISSEIVVSALVAIVALVSTTLTSSRVVIVLAALLEVVGFVISSTLVWTTLLLKGTFGSALRGLDTLR